RVAEDIYKRDHLIAKEGETINESLLELAQRSGVKTLPIIEDGELVEVRILNYVLPEGDRQLLRISKSALKTKGWLSAASFQRTTSALTNAALSGQSDKLRGLKPNIIVGKKIAVGTGFENSQEDEEEDEVEEADSEQDPLNSTA
ncbi:hypothetical protein KGY64_01185, partial [Candidatus Bipolaricaulota bacterium]|nr:hypothetical protein [Candidatus Bipolaricaulota bacterium]